MFVDLTPKTLHFLSENYLSIEDLFVLKMIDEANLHLMQEYTEKDSKESSIHVLFKLCSKGFIEPDNTEYEGLWKLSSKGIKILAEIQGLTT